MGYREETMKRFSALLLAGLATGPAMSVSAGAQDYPARQITLIAPWPAGVGKSVVVENRPGAGSVIGTAAGAKAAPDGYTVVMAGSGSLAISAALYKKLPYDPVKDLVPLDWPAGSHSFSWSTHRCRCARSPSS